MNRLSDQLATFGEPIYAVDEKNNLAVGKTKIYNLTTGEIIRFVPSHSTNNMFFDKSGKLHFFNGKDMYSLDPTVPIERLLKLAAAPEDKQDESPIDFPIIIKYNDKIGLIDKNNIKISDGKN